MTSNISIDLDCAKAILKTYQQVNDTTYGQHKNKNHRPKTTHKTYRAKAKESQKDLQVELNQLQEKYTLLQCELSSKEELVARLNRQLSDRTMHLEQLQADFENAIYQFNHKLAQNTQSMNVFE